MVPTLAFFALLLVALSLVATPSAAADKSTFDHIDAYLSDELGANGVPGAALAIVGADRTMHVKSFGETGRGGEKVEPQTPFIICSVSKSFTALAVVQLAERGRLELDAPVGNYLPWLELMPTDETGNVTVRTLLNQTSGLSGTAGGSELRYLDEKSITATAQSLSGEALLGPPGSDFHYSNANYVLLGALIEAISGMSYQDYVRRRILAPLRMSHTYLNQAEAEEAGLAEGHRYWFGLTFPHTSYSTGLIPAGGVISTAPDMGRYLRMMLNGGELGGQRVLSPRGIAALIRPAVSATVGPWAKDPEVSYGMGWYVGGAPFGPSPAVFHPGGSPDFGSMAALLPEQRQGLVLLYNVTPEVELPGAAGDVDRISAGAVSLLMGADPAGGWSMHKYYLFFDLIAAILLGFAIWLLVRSIRRPPKASAGSRFRNALRVAGAVTALLGGLLVLLFPALSGFGWRVLFLSVPDFTLVLAILGLIVMATGIFRLVRLGGHHWHTRKRDLKIK